MIITLSGITGVGKSYFKKCIINELNFNNIPVVTTREKRDKEKNGIDKHFVSKKEFDKLKQQGKIVVDFNFLDNEYAYYKDDLSSSCNGVTELHYDTIYEFKKFANNLLSIYIIPQSVEIAKKQLYKRNLKPNVIKLRLKEIEEQYEEFKNNKDLQNQFKYVLYNDYTEKTKNKLLEIIRKELVYA